MLEKVLAILRLLGRTVIQLIFLLLFILMLYSTYIDDNVNWT